MKTILPLFAVAILGAAPPTIGNPPNGGTIAIVPRATDDAPIATLRPFIDATAAALTARGFTILDDPAHAAATVELLVGRGDVGTALVRGAGQKPSMIGAGVSVPLSSGESQVVSLDRTRMEMRIRRRGETGVAWDGIAVTVREAETRKGSDATVAADLAQALLRPYPAQPTDIVGVP